MKLVIIILQILALGNIFRADFGLFYQIPRDIVDLYPITDVMDTYIFRVMRIYGDMSLSSAAGLLQSVVGFCMVMLTNFVVKFIDPDKSLF
jgi:putative aldouronate transport system permease protein